MQVCGEGIKVFDLLVAELLKKLLL